MTHRIKRHNACRETTAVPTANSEICYHGWDFAVGLKIFDNLALVSRLNSCEETCVADSLGLLARWQVVELAARIRLSFGRFRLAEHADTPADRLRCRLYHEITHAALNSDKVVTTFCLLRLGVCWCNRIAHLDKNVVFWKCKQINLKPHIVQLLRLVSATVYHSTSHLRSYCQSSAVALIHISSGAASRDYVVVP